MDTGIFEIGIDVGYGDVKTVVNNGGQIEYFKFPTAIAYAGDGFVLGGFWAETGVSEYQYNGRTYRVGKPALTNSGDILLISGMRCLDIPVRHSGDRIFN